MSSRIDTEDVVILRPAENSREPEPSGVFVLRPRAETGPPVELSGARWDGESIRVPLGGVRLAEGDYTIARRGADGATADLTTSDPGFSMAERAAYIARPRDRDLRVYRASDGGLRLRALAAQPYAEVDWVEITTGADGAARVAVSGTLAFTARPSGRAPATLWARQRERGGRTSVDTEVADGAFHCALPLGPLAEAHDFDRGNNEWDLWLQIGGHDTELRLSARADDIKGKKHRFAYPAVPLVHAARPLRAHPYYTVEDDLSILVRSARGAEEDA